MLRAVLCLVLLSAACTKSEPAAESAACCTNEAPAHAAAHEHAPAASTSGHVTARLPDLGPDDVRVVGSLTRDGVALSVQNHAAVNVKLKTALRIEHRASDRWVPVTATGLALRDSCAIEPAACVTLAPGAELLPPPWPAVAGRGQCGACAECPAITAGDYRVVVDACEGNGTSASSAFAVDAAHGR